MQTLRAGCSKAPRSQNFCSATDPLPGARDGQNLISWKWSLPSTTDTVWWRSMHAISSYHGNRPTNKEAHRHGQLQYTAPQFSVQCNDMIWYSFVAFEISNRLVLAKCSLEYAILILSGVWYEYCAVPCMPTVKCQTWARISIAVGTVEALHPWSP